MSPHEIHFPCPLHRNRVIPARLAAVLLYGLMCIILLLPAAGQCAEATSTDSAEVLELPSAGTTTTIHDVFTFIKGQPAGDTLYLGMWSWHFINDDDDYRSQHHLFGLCWQGIFLGTFLNSHNDRSWAGGWQRDIHTQRHGDLSLQIGHRIGLVHGYDELSLGGSKLFPLVQVYSDISYQNFGVQLSWAGSVFLAGFFFRFE